MRVGTGYDSHRFAAPEDGRRLVLGGVEVPHDRGLAGHSDADVVCHAVMDALLGAAGLGDIGTHFPDDDATWRNADSLDLLRTVLGQVPGVVLNVDATVICEAPKLAEHREVMERNLRDTLGAPASVKATTNEGMGWIGRGEGIACIALALIDA